MNRRELLKRALFYLSVPRCIHCKVKLDYGEEVFCTSCRAEFLEEIDRDCSICAKKISDCTCSSPKLEDAGIRCAVKVYRYLRRESITPSNDLIFSLKRDGRRDVTDMCVSLLSDSLSKGLGSPSDCILVNIPRRKAQIIKTGIDHAAILARGVAKKLGASYIPLLKSASKRAQKSLSETERLKNARFRLKSSPSLKGKTVVIVDDVITSGASMCEAARAIRTLGARKIVAACLAIAYKDEHESFGGVSML